MPYFVYKVYPNKTMDFLQQFDKFLDAKQYTRQLREQIQGGEQAAYNFRLIHAKHEEEAVKLLTTKREPRPLGEE